MPTRPSTRAPTATLGDAPFFSGLSSPARFVFYAGVFFTFSPLMLLTVTAFGAPHAHLNLLAWAAISGLIGVGWAVAFTYDRRALFFVIPFLALAVLAFAMQAPLRLGIARPRPSLEGFGIIAAIVAGYTCFVLFIQREGLRAVRLQAEITLAGRIHAALVPPVAAAAPGLEVYGRSDPSTEMGGDLIEVAAHGGATDIYLADVSGHGVRAGVVMGMVKSAIRMRLLAPAPLGTLLRDLNSVLHGTVEPGMFATFACLRFRPDGAVEYALAGHLPIFWHAAADGVVRDLENESLPLGLTADESYPCRAVTPARGDIFALYTDGLTEVQDRSGRELGHRRLAALVAEHAGRPLAEAHAAIMSAVRAHGVQGDDQTLLLARVV